MNMALDEALARTTVHPKGTPTFRIYYWNSLSLSLGYFQKAAEVLNSLSFVGAGFKPAPTLVRRPTGGTAVLHDSQPSFSLVIGRPVAVGQIYHLLGQVVEKALQALGMQAGLWEGRSSVSPLKRGVGGVSSSFCTSNFSPFDVILNCSSRACSAPRQSKLCHDEEIFQGQKVAGYSARRFREATLFQGYLHLPEPFKESLPSKKRGSGCVLAQALMTGFEEVTKLRLEEGTTTETETLLTQELRREKYLQRDWNYKR